MKIINYKSGLGNQIFYYLFTLYMKSKFPNETIYGYYIKKFLKKHNGLELCRAFDVSVPQQNYMSLLVGTLCRKIAGLGFNGFKSTDESFDPNAIYFDGWWQDKKYYLNNISKIKFRIENISKENIFFKNKIESCDSVSIHIRRGDYLQDKRYLNIATPDYYFKAIQYIKSKITNPFYFVFSDDINWVKANMNLENAFYITNNVGIESYWDMYLMSLCKNNIIANSSFSYWGAMLNQNQFKYVIYPAIWDNIKTPDIFPKDWIKING